MLKHFITTLCFLLLPLSATAEEPVSRNWRNSDGTKSFIGTYIGYEKGIVKISKGNTEYKLELSKLHPDDQSWVHEYESSRADSELNKQGVFDSLQFGDSHNTVLNKLKESSITVSNVGNSIFDGLSSISGKFQTKKTIGELQCFLHFKWDDQMETSTGKRKGLSGLELRSGLVPASEINTTLKNSWAEMVELFSILHGEADHAASSYPTPSEINQSGGIAGTHRWAIPTAEIILGPATDPSSNNYFLYVKIQKLK